MSAVCGLQIRFFLKKYHPHLASPIKGEVGYGRGIIIGGFMKKIFIITLLVLTVAALSANAQQQNQGGSERRGPPEEAISACNGLAENDSCSFEIQMEGTCFAPPQGESLACAPKNHQRGRSGGGRGQGQERGQRSCQNQQFGQQ